MYIWLISQERGGISKQVCEDERMVLHYNFLHPFLLCPCVWKFVWWHRVFFAYLINYEDHVIYDVMGKHILLLLLGLCTYISWLVTYLLSRRQQKSQV